MTTDPNGWPDASKPGVPLHPERNGWHWLHHPEDIRPIVQPWDAEHASWISGAMHSPQGVVDLGFRYLGPCLLPEEVAAREAAAAEAMREKAAESCFQPISNTVPRRWKSARDCAFGIHTIPLPAPDALARALGQARREGMEAAARIAQSVRVPFRDHEPAKYEIGVEIAAAIRAAMGGGDE